MTPAGRGLAYRINLHIDASYLRQMDAAVLRAAARRALQHQAAPSPSEVTIRVTGDGLLRTLNRDFRGFDRPTDVLSFPSGERDHTSGRLYLGDIAISYPRARQQAHQGQHPAQAELQLLIVHGVLHLLGHDHAHPAEKTRMWEAQAAILSELKAGITGPSDDGPAVS